MQCIPPGFLPYFQITSKQIHIYPHTAMKTTEPNLEKLPKDEAEDTETIPESNEGTPAGKAGEPKSEDASTSTLQALRDLTSDEDEVPEPHKRITLTNILGGDMLGGQWFRRNFFFMLMIVAMVVIYVGNRYGCQKEMIRTKMLTDTLLDRRYKALTRSSQLKEKTRRSYIEEALIDTTLQTANTPSYNLKVSK